jgi:small subunit ribosomal protein S13
MEVALTYIYGIGRPMARRILEEAKIEMNRKSDDVTEAEAVRIREVLEAQRQG